MSECLIVIPTVTGREESLNRTLDAYRETCPSSRFFVLKDKETCAYVWNYAAWWAFTCGGHRYVHMTADDLVPHPGWYEAAVETLDQNCGYLPGALIYRPDGAIESFGNQVAEDWSIVEGASVPFCRTEDWVRIPEIHYWSDNAFDYAQKRVHDYRFVMRHDYAFTHYTEPAGRKTLEDRERVIYEEWKESL